MINLSRSFRTYSGIRNSILNLSTKRTPTGAENKNAMNSVTSVLGDFSRRSATSKVAEANPQEPMSSGAGESGKSLSDGMEKIIYSFTSDQPEYVPCDIKGTVPEWLEGRLYRNGPAKFSFGKDYYKHLFDMMAVIHCYEIKDGLVRYHNRLLDSDTYQANKAAKRIVVSEFGTTAYHDPCKARFQFLSSFFQQMKVTDNDSVNVMLLGDQMYAMTETPKMNIVDMDTLDRVQQVDLNKYVSVHTSTAHPLQDHDGSTYNLGTQFGRHATYKFVRVPKAKAGDSNPASHVELIGSIPSQWAFSPNYAHSFGMTENYLIFVEQPVAISLFGLMSAIIRGKPFLEAFRTYEKSNVKFRIIHKYTGQELPMKFEAAPFFVFHHINAYEDGQHIVLDLCGYDDFRVLDWANLKNFCDSSQTPPLAYVKRFVIPLEKAGGDSISLDYTTATAHKQENGSIFCTPEHFKEVVMELPRIHYEKYNCRKYRYSYGIQALSPDHNRLVKFDIVAKKQKHWRTPDHIPGEPIFVAHPEGKAEDDGVILAPCLSYKGDQPSLLIILDAASFTELARAEIPKDIHVPVTFHGLFTDKMSKQ